MELVTDPDNTELHDSDHIDQAFDALNDTMNEVAGVEGLTRAQTYMWGVLNANGDLSYQQRVAGTEGFFSAIGDGVNKVWEYIKKMFNAILNFFGLGGGSDKTPSVTALAGATLKQNQTNIAVVLTGQRAGQAEDLAKQVIRSQADLDAFMNSPQTSPSDKAEAGELRAKLKDIKALPAPEQQRVVKEVVERFVKINRRMQQALDDASTSAVAEYEKYRAVINRDHSQEFAGTFFEEMYGDYKAIMTSSSAQSITSRIKIPHGMRTLGDAARAQEDLDKAVRALENESSSISIGIKSDIIHHIKRLEEQVKRKDLQDKNRTKFNKDLAACRRFLQLTTEAIKMLRSTCENIRRISNMINRYFSIIAG